MRSSLPALSDAAASDRILPDHILDIAYAFRKSKALLSAVELGVFTALADGPLDGGTLMARAGIHARGGRDFLDHLERGIRMAGAVARAAEIVVLLAVPPDSMTCEPALTVA